ncbi:hypothetical protein D7Y09_13670 [bacterium 1XD42-1]|nr:hypothetical protein D7X25_25730 [bacterium 1XD42-8]RKJ62489.1 hypothetical protein D7Y09_13670 [bacterium 1XD42-1]
MSYNFKYPEVYAELARQGKTKKALADLLEITLGGLRYKQSVKTTGDFDGEEIRKITAFLGCSANYLFGLESKAG